ncbi:hypothetical protein [uncultured Desulfosarcina sp.]|uniref:hypothetical protein n=1 Tax=uncultured Desulfosarcina sp. TaxID=218289 RepID=UPI0029C81BAC|nr:hypothetical protein [uncultured Desulfosarcina sp.]
MSDQTVPEKSQRLNAEVTTIERSPCLKDNLDALRSQMWPAFLNHASDCRWKLLAEHFPGYQMLLVADKHPVAVGHTVPLAWNQSADGLPDSIEDTLLSAIRRQEAGKPANTLAVLGVFVSADCQGNGLSTLMLTAVKQLANAQGFASMIVPVRPSSKTRYPLVSMKAYIARKRADGSPFDPTIRYHWNAGATVIKTAPRAMTVIGTVADWENWTEMRFVESGEYIVDGALKPVLIDLASDHGWYEDPFLWMHHFIERKNDQA